MKEISTDFQGWPVKAMTWNEILQAIGIINEEPKCEEYKVNINNPILNTYPKVLEDDGMGYGVNPRFIVSSDYMIYKDDELNEEVSNIFVEPINKEHCKMNRIKQEPSTEEITQFVNNILSCIESEGDGGCSSFETEDKAKMIKLLFDKFGDYLDGQTKEKYQGYLKYIS